MQNIHHHVKLRRGSSPHQEMRDGFVDWVWGLRSIKEHSKNSREDLEKGSSVATYVPEDELDDEQRWQDDGGEGG